MRSSTFPIKLLSSVDFLLRGVYLIRVYFIALLFLWNFCLQSIFFFRECIWWGVLHGTPFPMKILSSVNFLLRGVYLMRVYFIALLFLWNVYLQLIFFFGEFLWSGVFQGTPFPIKLLSSVNFLLQGVYLIRVYFTALLSLWNFCLQSIFFFREFISWGCTLGHSFPCETTFCATVTMKVCHFDFGPHSWKPSLVVRNCKNWSKKTKERQATTAIIIKDSKDHKSISPSKVKVT